MSLASPGALRAGRGYRNFVERRDLRRDEALHDNNQVDGYLSRRLISAEAAILPSFT